MHIAPFDASRDYAKGFLLLRLRILSDYDSNALEEIFDWLAECLEIASLTVSIVRTSAGETLQLRAGLYEF